MKTLLLVISIVVVLFVVLIAEILTGNHAIRYDNGYDSELENDYHAMIFQIKETGGKEK